MGLLLKSLRQIDWQPPKAAAAEVVTECAAPAPAPAEEVALEEAAARDAAADIEPEALSPPVESQEDELAPTREAETQSQGSTLTRLNELQELIDAAMEGFSDAAPMFVQSPAADPMVSPPAFAAEELQALSATDRFSPVDASSATVVPPPAVPPPPASSAPLNWAPARKIRDEYRELRDHLLARFPVDEPCTLLAIDAGRVASDASWLAPFAASLWESLGEKPAVERPAGLPKILLVEAAGAESGIARHLGLDCPQGLGEVLQGTIDWNAAIQPTWHPQIELLSCGSESLQSSQNEKLRSLWGELQRRYQVILVAAGPWEAVSQASWRKTGMATAAAFVPLADAAVLCVELEGTPQTVAIETKQTLERRGIRLLGCVVSGQ